MILTAGPQGPANWRDQQPVSNTPLALSGRLAKGI
jgi:hypothetical protein